jgi:hypothetical protein
MGYLYCLISEGTSVKPVHYASAKNDKCWTLSREDNHTVIIYHSSDKLAFSKISLTL